MSNLILFLQVILILAGALSLAVLMMNFAVPVAVNEVPEVLSIIFSWMRPFYLHIVVNGIIITIAASSRFLQNRSEPPIQSQHLISVKTPPPAYFAAYSPQSEDRALVPATSAEYEIEEDRVVELKAVMVNGSEVHFLEAEEEETAAETEPDAEAEDSFLDRKSTYDTVQPERFPSDDESEYILPVKPIRNNPQIAPPETLESAWKKITEGASRATHKQKSKSFKEKSINRYSPPSPASSTIWKEATPSQDELMALPSSSPDIVPKSKSFKERSINSDSPPSSTIWKEASPSQDELNRRVEAFIKKVNDEMRLRRQESLNQYMEMVNSGVH